MFGAYFLGDGRDVILTRPLFDLMMSIIRVANPAFAGEMDAAFGVLMRDRRG